MTQDLVSSAPAMYEALLALVQAAAAAQNPPVLVYPFELGEYEPGSYITLSGIVGPDWDWDYLGSYTQRETYEIAGAATVYSGATISPGSTVVTDVLNQTQALFQACVMTPVISNRDMPFLQATGANAEYVNIMRPGRMGYRGEPAIVDGKPAGWVGVYDWSFQFEAKITPA